MKHILIFIAVLVVLNTSIYSQHKGQFGFEFSFSQFIILADEVESLTPAIGFKVFAADDMSIRVKLSYQNSSREQEYQGYDPISMTSTTEILELNSQNLGVGLDLSFYFLDNEDVNSYLGGGINFSQLNQEMIDYSTTDNSVIEQTNSTYRLNGFVGLEYTPSPQFTVFGEMGINYLWSERDRNNYKSSSFGLFNAGVGVTFFLN